MKFRVWMRIYPHQMADRVQFKPFYSAEPLAPSEDGSKILAFDVEVPDDLFGVKQVEAVATDDVTHDIVEKSQ